MANPVYTQTVFAGQVVSEAPVTLFTVPDGYAYVVRTIAIRSYGSGSGAACFVVYESSDASTAGLWSTGDEGAPGTVGASIDLAVGMAVGDKLTANTTDGATTFDVYVSAYVLPLM